MDVFVEFFKSHIYNVFIAGAILLLVKVLLAGLHKGFNFTRIVISFFTFYDKVEIESIGNSRRASYMWWNNVLNISIYIWILLIASVFFVTLNSNEF